MSVSPEERWDNEFMKEFEKESDRACVILSASMLDQALESLLKAYLVPLSSAEDELLDGAYAPISTFSARIDLAYRLGLISTKFCHDLHLIRKIRNDFAHNITECNFENVSVHGKVSELCRSSGLIEKEPQVRKRFQHGTKGDFQMIVSWMLWSLNSCAGKISPIESCSPEAHYWSKEQLEEAEKLSEKLKED
jgi:DNA-binding MltR family transcriptional regulator